MRLLLKRGLGRISSRLKALKTPRKVILLYHSVGTGPWAISEHNFRLQMEWLCRTGTLISLDRLLTGNLSDALQVSITFDDGYACLHDFVLPILSKLGVVATVFVNVGRIGANGERNPSDPNLGYYPGECFLSSEDLRHLVRKGWSVGSHGVGHLDLTAVSEHTARQELAELKRMIENMLSASCTMFAYTWGRHNVVIRRLLAETGYRYAFSGHHASLGSVCDATAVPRMNIASEYTASDFKSIVVGNWDYLGWIQRMKGK